MEKLADMLTYPKDVEPRRVIVVHDLRPLDDTYKENPTHKPPDVVCYLSPKMPSKVLANTFPPGNSFGKVRLLFFLLCRKLEYSETTFFVAAECRERIQGPIGKLYLHVSRSYTHGYLLNG